jgi:hypothetical protein
LPDLPECVPFGCANENLAIAEVTDLGGILNGLDGPWTRDAAVTVMPRVSSSLSGAHSSSLSGLMIALMSLMRSSSLRHFVSARWSTRASHGGRPRGQAGGRRNRAAQINRGPASENTYERGGTRSYSPGTRPYPPRMTDVSCQGTENAYGDGHFGIGEEAGSDHATVVGRSKSREGRPIRRGYPFGAPFLTSTPRRDTSVVVVQWLC